MIPMMAWRNIWRNKGRSIVIMLSVAIGLLAGLGVLALYKGMMKSRVRTVIYSEVSHLQVHNPLFKQEEHPAHLLPTATEIARDIGMLPEVKYVAPRSLAQGMLATSAGSAGVRINGVEPRAENNVSQLQRKLVTGSGFSPNKKNEIIIGRKLADKLKLKLHAKVVLTLTDTADNLVSGAYRVTGIYQSGNAPRDEVNIYMPITSLNELLMAGDSFHELAIILRNDDGLEQTQARLAGMYPTLKVESWKEISPETDLMVKTVNDYSYLIMIIILIALAFGILNTMLMSVLERTKELGMMVALGTSRRRVFLLVLTESIFLTCAGMPVGLAAGYVLTSYFQKNGLDLSGMGKEMMESFGFDTMIYPEFPWDKLVAVALMVVGTAILSSLLPAWRAVRLRPVTALRK